MGSNSFLSSEAENALRGGEEAARRLFPERCGGALPTPTPYTSQQQQFPAGWNRQIPVIEPVSNSYIVECFSGSIIRSPQQTWEPLQLENFNRTVPGEISDTSGPTSPSNSADLQNFGYKLQDGVSWRCAHPDCTSTVEFTRGCDLRKHFKRHTKSLFCRHEDCPQSIDGGFSSKKDRDRHEAKHKPGISCEWEGCDRVFSRVDNMKDHVRRIHRKGLHHD